MSPRVPLVTAVSVLIAATGACGENRAAPPPPSPSASVTDRATEVGVRIELDSDKITVAGSITARMTLTWPDGVHAEPITPVVRSTDEDRDSDAAPRPPEIVQETLGPIRFTDDEFTRTVTLRIEPDLPGSFELADAGARIDPDDGDRRIVRLRSVPFEVVSVLKPADASELEPSIGFRTPEAPSHADAGRWIILGAAALFAACIAIVTILKRPGRGSDHAETDPLAMARAAIEQDELDDAALDALYHAAIEITPDGPDTAALIRELDTARFGRSRTAARRAHRLARRVFGTEEALA